MNVLSTSTCVENGRCIDTEDGFRCDCNDGFLYNTISKRCDGKCKQ